MHGRELGPLLSGGVQANEKTFLARLRRIPNQSALNVVVVATAATAVSLNFGTVFVCAKLEKTKSHILVHCMKFQHSVTMAGKLQKPLGHLYICGMLLFQQPDLRRPLVLRPRGRLLRGRVPVRGGGAMRRNGEEVRKGTKKSCGISAKPADLCGVA